MKLLSLTEKGTKRAEEVHRQCTVMRENLYRNLTDDEKKELIRLLDKILGTKEAPEVNEAASGTNFTIIGEGMTCGPDGCCFG